MFEATRLFYHSIRTLVFFKLAARARKRGDKQVSHLFLLMASSASHAAESIQSSKITEQQRLAATDRALAGQRLYLQAVHEGMSEEECDVFRSIMQWRVEEMGLATTDVDSFYQMISMFELAKSRLNMGKEVLNIVYEGDHVPTPLRDIMQPFLAGKATQEETAKRLDKFTATVRKWVPEVFPLEVSST